MKKLLLLSLIAGFSAAAANDGIITLDLTRATTKLEFNADNGSWTGTYDDDSKSIESQIFSFVHKSFGDYNTWWGFTASNCANNSQPESFPDFQWANMAAGGIELDEEGNVKLTENGAPVVNAEIPYMVGFYMPFMNPDDTALAFNDKKNYEPQGVYVNLTSYPYYTLEYGLAPARPFTDGDKFTLTIHGIAPDETKKTVTVTLCSYADGDITINRGWKYVDLTSLGVVNEIRFTMESTDTGAYGMNTPAYFALDKLTVKEAAKQGINSPKVDSINIDYDRASNTVTWTGVEFADVQNTLGQTLMASDSGKLSLASLPAGVYIVRAGAKSLKIVK